MNKKAMQGYVTLICVIIIILIGTLIGFMYAKITMVPEVINNTITLEPTQKPMLLIEVAGWGENMDNPNQALFQTYIYNFGSVEAKDVVVECIVSSASDVEKYRQTFSLGNIASNSNEYEEFNLDNYVIKKDDDTAECNIKSASGDYINLLDNIYDL